MYGRSALTGADSNYNTFGGGGLQSTQSAFSLDPREERSRKTWDLINRVKGYRRLEEERNEKRVAHKATINPKNGDQRRKNEEQKLEDDARRAYQDRQSKLNRIGSFKFDIDNTLDVEILTSDQVFEDLDDIKNIREKTGGDEQNSAYKSLVMAMYTRGKKKKKR